MRLVLQRLTNKPVSNAWFKLLRSSSGILARHRTKLTTLRLESRQFASTANLTYPTCIWCVRLRWFHLSFEFCRDFRHQKTRVPGLSCGVVCVILRLAVSVEHRLVTDGQTDTWRQLIPALAGVARVKPFSGEDPIHGCSPWRQKITK